MIDGLTPQLDEQWEKCPLGNGQFYLGVPGMEKAATWPMREEIIDRILADHNGPSVDWYEHACELADALEYMLSYVDGDSSADRLAYVSETLERYRPAADRQDFS